ncbi:MAG: PTS glucose transporter subunit IIA [Paludibacterium sp.]|uniref:PTS sugar transporter subunit IIA n=1 Tax=Paludibacterium sp. TaxID=1917523 RepID=UPI0025EF07A1|nr:PTS glucose transporter subunit IIA [Paludibacterium sp.]MBV8046916.1 PTS glucose transporter subunit IIA [Paludibacterium sp.]MBV8646362.1 PTS glucose transporter subunit IIA [Paludibacterium sp.]
MSSIKLVAPFSGSVVPLANVPDPVFSGQMMGDGLGVNPTSNTLVAPCDGIITQVARTSHALTLTADNGAEVLMHIGIDTVKLNGQGFSPRVRQGQRVKQGEALIDVDFASIKGKVPSITSVVVIANSDDYTLSGKAAGSLSAGQSAFMTVTSR